MRRWFRQHRYALKVALRRLARQPFSSLSNIVVISLSLTVPILAASVLQSAQPIVRHIPVSPEITLFLDVGASLQDARNIADGLRADHPDLIQALRIVPREQASARLRQQTAWAEALAALETNPLPHALVVTLHESSTALQHATELAQGWRLLDKVDTVQLDSDWVQRLGAILDFLRIGLGLLAAGVALVVLATVFNTVRMQALSQREEIAIARLVGATETFVRRPFLYLGGMTGLISGLLAIGFASLALLPLNTVLDRLASTYGTVLSLRLPEPASLALALLLVTILAALAARWSVTRNTRF